MILRLILALVITVIVLGGLYLAYEAHPLLGWAIAFVLTYITVAYVTVAIGEPGEDFD